VLRELLPGHRWPVQARKYLGWDDSRAEALIFSAARSGKSPLARLIARREHFKVVFEAPEADVASRDGDYSALRRTLEQRFGPEIFVDMEHRPLVRDRELTVPIVRKGGSEFSPWVKESVLFSVLPPLTFFRVYAPRNAGFAEEVRNICEDFLSRG
jgi:hypothetical protein